jgi:hypothetical protein
MSVRIYPCGHSAFAVAAVKSLDPKTAETLLICARAKIRPDWMPEARPQLIPKITYPKRRRGRHKSYKSHKPVTVMVWDIPRRARPAAAEAGSRSPSGSRVRDDRGRRFAEFCGPRQVGISDGVTLMSSPPPPPGGIWHLK